MLTQKRDWTIILALVVLGVATEIIIGILTVMGASEYIAFGIAMILFVAVLAGSYLYVIVPTPQSQQEERDND